MGRIWSGNNRAPWHDYRSRQIYHITLMKRADVPSFGHLAGDWRVLPGLPGSPFVMASFVGKAIKESLREIKSIHPSLKILQYALMPDHLHILLYVESTLDEILGRKIAAFKVSVNKRADLDSVFEKGFNDQIITAVRNLDVIYKYLRHNAYRLAVRVANPDYFRQASQVEIDGKQYAVYGNLQLFDSPFKEQVVVHRADSDEQKKSNAERWLYVAANGGVLVSPFISSGERLVRDEAILSGGRFIVVVHESFGERFKPSGQDFALCVEGRLLIVTLGLQPGAPLSRSICLRMNDLAKSIAEKEMKSK